MSDKGKRYSTNWRKILRINKLLVNLVSISYIFIFFLLGLSLDVIRIASKDVYNCNTFISSFLNWDLILSIISFKRLPVITCFMVGVAIIIIISFYVFHEKIIFSKYKLKKVSEYTRNHKEKEIYNILSEVCISSNLGFCPRLYVIKEPFMNAFASGYSKKTFTVAVTNGLIENLSRSEIQAVISHEISHIKHNDTKIMLFISVLCNIIKHIINIIFDSLRGKSFFASLILLLFKIILTPITFFLFLFLSRTCEYRADAGSVKILRDNIPIAKALLKLNYDYTKNYKEYTKSEKKVFYSPLRQINFFNPIIDNKLYSSIKSFSDIISTHPTLEKRLMSINISNKRRFELEEEIKKELINEKNYLKNNSKKSI